MSQGTIVEEVRETGMTRLNERLRNPFLFTYLTVFCLREWPFLYTIATDLGSPAAQTIAEARRLLSFWSIWVDALIAFVITIAWPHIDRELTGYLAGQKVATENRKLRALQGMLLTLRALGDHPRFRTAKRRLSGLREFAAHLATENLGIQGEVHLAVGGNEPLKAPSFVHAMRDEDGFLVLYPRSVSLGMQSHEIVYVVESLTLENERFFICASVGSRVPWPRQFPGHIELLVWDESEGFVETKEHLPNRLHLLRSPGDTHAKVG